MKIAGFNISKKMLIVIGVIVVIIIIWTAVSNDQKRKEIERRNAEAQAAMMANQQVDTGEVLDYHAQLQARLSERFGIAPDGFEWDYDGTLIAIGDGSMNAEDVVYGFLRAVSMLDFSTASLYSLDSTVIKKYQGYYDSSTIGITDYYDNFLRKQLKASISSLEVLGIGDVAVFNDGTEYITVNVRALDLTDKDFWRDDRDELFTTMYTYKDTESDTVKLNSYLYDYISNKYSDGTIGKKDYTIEIVVTKDNGGAWLVTNDKELCSILEYEQGVDVARYITQDFNDWYVEQRTK